jgi:F0F1-type ATP synthase assembly protein I
LKREKPDKKESAWVTVARYSEIGFMIPASVIVGYLLGLLADHLLRTHWIYLVGIIVGAVAGFYSMIKRALASSKDVESEESAESEDEKRSGGNGPNAG